MANDDNNSNSDNGKQFLLELDRLNCIGCGACVAVSPDHWELLDDGKASIIGGSERPDSWLELPIEKADVQSNVEAAESCPVSVIHVTSIKDGKKLI